MEYLDMKCTKIHPILIKLQIKISILSLDLKRFKIIYDIESEQELNSHSDRKTASVCEESDKS